MLHARWIINLDEIDCRTFVYRLVRLIELSLQFVVLIKLLKDLSHSLNFLTN